MTEHEDSTMERLPGATIRVDGPGRFVGHVSTVLIVAGWLGGLAVSVLVVISAYHIFREQPELIPGGLMDEWWPKFRDRPTFSALAVGIGGLATALVPVMIIGGMGYLLRLLVRLEQGVGRLLDRLEEGA